MTASTRPGPANPAKALVLDAFTEFARGNTGILRSVFAEDIVEHSPGNPSGREALIEHLLAQPVARARLHLKRVIAEGDLVALHYHLEGVDGGRGLAVMDIWRVDSGLIVEHWDIVQEVPEDRETPNGMF